MGTETGVEAGVEAGGAATVAAPAPGIFRQLIAALKLRYRIKWRLFRRRIVLRIRNVIRLDEDGIRDQLVDGLRRDLGSIATALGQAMAAVNALNDRLEYHESKIPRMRLARTEFDHGRRAAKEQRDLAVEKQVKEQHEQAERLKDGILAVPGGLTDKVGVRPQLSVSRGTKANGKAKGNGTKPKTKAMTKPMTKR